MYNKKAMIELKKLLIKKYPEIIDKLILFGSRAENRENEFSDYDILLILKEQYSREFEENVLDIAYDIILKYDILTDLKFITNDELQTIKGALPFVQSAMTNGVVI